MRVKLLKQWFQGVDGYIPVGTILNTRTSEGNFSGKRWYNFDYQGETWSFNEEKIYNGTLEIIGDKFNSSLEKEIYDLETMGYR